MNNAINDWVNKNQRNYWKTVNKLENPYPKFSKIMHVDTTSVFHFSLTQPLGHFYEKQRSSDLEIFCHSRMATSSSLTG